MNYEPTRNETAELAMIDYTNYWSEVEGEANKAYQCLLDGNPCETKNEDVFNRVCELACAKVPTMETKHTAIIDSEIETTTVRMLQFENTIFTFIISKTYK